MMTNIPVLLIVFNRPETTRFVFDQIRKAKPARLYVAADGPRDSRSGEHEQCDQVRKIVTEIDWDCKVKTLFRDKNLGCKNGVTSAIDWLFDNEEQGIILEDDCVPEMSFFRYCEDLLEHFKDDERIMHINGNNYGYDQSKWHNYSYSFCSYSHVWGWATWKRSWSKYDKDMKTWPDFLKENQINNFGYSKKVIISRKERWEKVYHNLIDTWDFQWHYCVAINNGLSISPKVNLIKNIGHNENATHTKVIDKNANIKSHEIEFPLKHPLFMIPDKKTNKIYIENMLHQSLYKRIYYKLKKYIKL